MTDGDVKSHTPPKKTSTHPAARPARFRTAGSAALSRARFQVRKLKRTKLNQSGGRLSKFRRRQNTVWWPRGGIAPVRNVIKWARGSHSFFRSFQMKMYGEFEWKKYLRGCWIFVIHAAVCGWNEFWDELSAVLSPLTFQRCAAFEPWIYCNLFFSGPPPIIDAWFSYKL